METKQTNCALLTNLFFKCGSCEKIMDGKIYESGRHQLCENCSSKQPFLFRNFAAEAVFSFITKQDNTVPSTEAVLLNQETQKTQEAQETQETETSPSVEEVSVQDNPNRRRSIVCPVLNCNCKFPTFEDLKTHITSDHHKCVTRLRQGNPVTTIFIDNKSHGSASLKKMVLFNRMLLIIYVKVRYDNPRDCNVKVCAVTVVHEHEDSKLTFALNGWNSEAPIARYGQCKGNPGLNTGIDSCKQQKLTITFKKTD